MEDDANELPAVPALPQRAAIYIAPDGTVHFGALFEALVPVADALGHPGTGSARSEEESAPRVPDHAP